MNWDNVKDLLLNNPGRRKGVDKGIQWLSTRGQFCLFWGHWTMPGGIFSHHNWELLLASSG